MQHIVAKKRKNKTKKIVNQIKSNVKKNKNAKHCHPIDEERKKRERAARNQEIFSSQNDIKQNERRVKKCSWL